MPRQWSLSLTDATGKVVYVTKGTETSLSYTGNLMPGFYSLVIIDTQNNAKKTSKFLIQ